MVRIWKWRSNKILNRCPGVEAVSIWHFFGKNVIDHGVIYVFRESAENIFRYFMFRYSHKGLDAWNEHIWGLKLYKSLNRSNLEYIIIFLNLDDDLRNNFNKYYHFKRVCLFVNWWNCFSSCDIKDMYINMHYTDIINVKTRDLNDNLSAYTIQCAYRCWSMLKMKRNKL